jgi:diguanylate cyclase (GGDEF)-like protein
MRKGAPVSLIFIDIDYFKNYNDNYGHQKGDRCLQKISEQLHTISKRPKDIAARYGGEEFVVLLPDTQTEGAVMLAENIRKSIELLKIPHGFSDAAAFVTISLGVATVTPSQETKSSGLVKLADMALYEAKDMGRNRVYLHPGSSKKL